MTDDYERLAYIIIKVLHQKEEEENHDGDSVTVVRTIWRDGTVLSTSDQCCDRGEISEYYSITVES